MADVEVLSVITGNVWKIVKEVGDVVEEDEPIVILESMKMEIPISAPEDGKIKKIAVKEGEVVQEGALVAMLESD